MASHFHHKGLPVPRVFAVSDDQNAYLQEDLGNTQLFDLIKNRRGQDFDEPTLKLLTRTMQDLARFQFEGAEGMDFGKCYPQPEFNRRSALWDLNYFKYCFLKATGTEFQEDRLEDDFERMADTLAQASPRAFMYRDFQSRNVMISQESPRFIDFQADVAGRCSMTLLPSSGRPRPTFPTIFAGNWLKCIARLFKLIARWMPQILKTSSACLYFSAPSRYWELTDSEVTSNRNLIFWKAFLMHCQSSALLEEPYPEYPYLS